MEELKTNSPNMELGATLSVSNETETHIESVKQKVNEWMEGTDLNVESSASSERGNAEDLERPAGDIGQDVVFEEERGQSISIAGSVIPEQRMPKLKRAIDRVVRKCLSAVTWKSFQDNFSMLNTSNEKAALRNTYTSFNEKLKASIKEEVDLMLTEEKMSDLLLKLDAVSKRSRNNPAGVWRPSGTPQDDVAAHLMGPLLRFKHSLESIQREEEVECERLRRTVTERRRVLAVNLKLANANREKYLQVLEDVDKLSTFLTEKKSLHHEASHSATISTGVSA